MRLQRGRDSSRDTDLPSPSGGHQARAFVSYFGVFLTLSTTFVGATSAAAQRKKTDVSEHPGVFDHVGLLVNGPTGIAGLPFI